MILSGRKAKNGAPRAAVLFSPAVVRLITSFCPIRLRGYQFPRYGATEYPFPAALKTGTSQAYRDAWIVAYSAKYIVGVWIGRGDAGPMNRLSGARAAAPLAKAILMQLHSVLPGDIAEAKFPPPEGRAAVELCVIGGKRSNGQCGQTLTEWLRPDETPPMEEAPAPLEGNGSRSTFPRLTALGPGRKASPSMSGQALAHRHICLSLLPSIIAAFGAIPRRHPR